MRIIYAAYGSNLLKERFLVYMKGGEYKNHFYKGCKNKTEPIDRGWMYVPYRLYFAKESSKWENKGVAFLTCEKEEDKDYHALVRLWEIEEDQFDEIWEQEGKSWYHMKIYLGEKDGIKIYTITGCWLDEINPPSESYLQVIKDGLKETTNWDNDKIERYLKKFLP